jgi:hypothetical protein
VAALPKENNDQYSQTAQGNTSRHQAQQRLELVIRQIYSSGSDGVQQDVKSNGRGIRKIKGAT